MELIGKKVTFPENRVRFYQDHSFWVGIPDGVEFTIMSKDKNKYYYWLQADGYGNLDKPGCYGNGKILVGGKDIEEHLKPNK